MATKQAPDMLTDYGGSLEGNSLPEGDYYSVATPVRENTNNRTWWDFWSIVSSSAQKISTNPAFDQPMVTLGQLEAAINGINQVFAEGSMRVETRANLLFSRTYGKKRSFEYVPYPLRWLGSSRLGLSVLDAFHEALYAIPQVPSNDIDSGLIDNHLGIVLRPLFDVKADIMRTYCGVEVKGEISPDELDAIFRDSNLRPPLQHSIDDRRDNAADRAAEDAVALTDETGPVPDIQTLELVTSGKDVWSWGFTPQNRLRVGELLRRSEHAGATFSPGEPFPFGAGTADVSSTPTGGRTTTG